LAANNKKSMLRRKAPQIIAVAIILILVGYVSFEFLEDVFIEGTPITSDPLVSTIMSLTHDLKNTVRSWGYAGIFGLMILESSSLPVPSEVILPFAGYLVSEGTLNFWLTLIVATAAALAGSMIDYYIGYKGIEALTRRKILGRVIFSMEQLTYAGRWFSKYGAVAIFVGRLVPGIRTLISFPAGAAKMPLAKFLAFTAAGCILWNGILIYVGYYLRQNWAEVASVSHYILIGVVAALVAIVLVFVVRRQRRKKRQPKQLFNHVYFGGYVAFNAQSMGFPHLYHAIDF
jgi:membrane protein DedA with SNARE-associated domain